MVLLPATELFEEMSIPLDMGLSLRFLLGVAMTDAREDRLLLSSLMSCRIYGLGNFSGAACII